MSILTGQINIQYHTALNFTLLPIRGAGHEATS